MVDDKERARLVNVIRALANMLVSSHFLSFRFLVNVIDWTLENTIILFVLFFITLVTVNIWVYYTFEKKPQNQTTANSH